MHSDITKIIDRYLTGELSEADSLAFEERLSTNTELRQELALHQLIQEASIRASFRSDVQETARRYKLNRVIKWGAAGFGGLALIALLSVWVWNSSDGSNDESTISTISLSLMEKMNPTADFEGIPIQYFSVPKEGDVFLSDQSVLLSVPENAFLFGNKPYFGEAIVQFQEALSANEIVKSGLNTMTGTHLLETQGMFSIHAFTPNGQALELNPAVGIYVQVPVEEYKDGMQLYDLVQLSNGKSDWQNPRGLAKIPVPVAMNDLDFYPVGYEKQLDDLKWKQSKKQRDSLYLSFENYCGESMSSFPIEKQSQNEVITVSMDLTKRSAMVPFPAIEASYPGGTTAMRTFISNQTNYPEKAKEQNLQGRVYVSFIVDEVGRISDVRVEKSVHPLLDQEAVRVVQSMPPWTPAKDKSVTVKSRVRLPISFTLSGGNSTRKKPQAGLLSYSVLSSSPQVEEPQSQVKSAARSGTPISDSTELADTPCDFPHISPSRVLAFWKPSFNNTNLATREFEQRMKAIHGTCNNAVLQKYTSQLTKPLSEIDQEVAEMGYAEFIVFAHEQVGVMDVNNPHLKNLQNFYTQGIDALQQQAEKDENWERTLRNKWDNHLSELRNAHTISTRKNKQDSEQQEIAFNQQRTIQKLGLSEQRINPVSAYPQFRNSIGFTIRRAGGYNCDRVVSTVVTYETLNTAYSGTATIVPATQSRQEQRLEVSERVKTGTADRATFDVKINGKTQTISYNNMRFSVANHEKYDRLFAYIFPHELESYQLIEGKDGNFDYQMNNDIVYDICIVGINGDGFAYFQKQTFKGSDLGSISLNWLTEKNLDANLLQMNANRKKRVTSIQPDLAWIKAEGANYKEVNRRETMRVFRQKIVNVVYPCIGTVDEQGIAAEDNNPFGI